MPRPPVIGLTGPNSSGKGKTAEILVEELGYAPHSLSDMLREEARRRGGAIIDGGARNGAAAAAMLGIPLRSGAPINAEPGTALPACALTHARSAACGANAP